MIPHGLFVGHKSAGVRADDDDGARRAARKMAAQTLDNVPRRRERHVQFTLPRVALAAETLKENQVGKRTVPPDAFAKRGRERGGFRQLDRVVAHVGPPRFRRAAVADDRNDVASRKELPHHGPAGSAGAADDQCVGTTMAFHGPSPMVAATRC